MSSGAELADIAPVEWRVEQHAALEANLSVEGSTPDAPAGASVLGKKATVFADGADAQSAPQRSLKIDIFAAGTDAQSAPQRSLKIDIFAAGTDAQSAPQRSIKIDIFAAGVDA
jgi:hypothetical protein